jgi:hypothetical protein
LELLAKIFTLVIPKPVLKYLAFLEIRIIEYKWAIDSIHIHVSVSKWMYSYLNNLFTQSLYGFSQYKVIDDFA